MARSVQQFALLAVVALVALAAAHVTATAPRVGAVVPPVAPPRPAAAVPYAPSFGPTEPQQVHTATTSDDVTRSVSWVTLAATAASVVQWGTAPDALSASAQGRSYAFVDADLWRRTIYIHNAVFGGAGSPPLQPATRYYYRVGDPSAADGWSPVFNFTTFAQPYPLLDLLVYGDFGVVNDQSQVALVAEIAKHTPEQMIIHVGDFGYDMHDYNGTRGDVFMNQIQPLAAYVPYMTCLGNHEQAWNFSHYTNRFSLISDTVNTRQNWWYSWDMSYVHFVAFNSELYYLQPWYDLDLIAQYEWLEKDLAAVDRSKTPWVVVYGHRPLYCSNVDDLPDCSTDAQVIRDGTVIGGVNYGLDDLFHRFGVDIFFTAHEHSYERTFPVWNYQVDVPADPNVYVDAKYPTHIVTGAAGCQEQLDFFSNVTWGNWSAVRSSSYGYGHLRLVNASCLHWTQELNEGVDAQTDDVWFVKTGAAVADPPRGDWNVARDLPNGRDAYTADRPAAADDADDNGGVQGPCDRYCFGVCKRYQVLGDCAKRCRCERHAAAGHDALLRLAAECAPEVSVEKSIRR